MILYRHSLIRAFAVPSALALSAVSASAQVAPGTVQQSPSVGSRAADALSRDLRTLTTQPKDLNALKGAGGAALDLGDANAALGFYARAEEIAPRDGQVKAGLGRALLMAERPREALKLFHEATDLGVPDAEIAGDRGLAYDLRGDAKRAQKDYALALTRGADDEVTRRYALSLGITGDRDQALKLLDPLLYKRDQGAWRARAFVLAMTGDLPGANTIVHQVMPARLATAMEPFLVRLAALRASDKAMAVHLGQFPSDGTRTAAVEGGAAYPAGAIVQPLPSASQTATAREPVSREPRRRPGRVAIGPKLPVEQPRTVAATTAESSRGAATQAPPPPTVDGDAERRAALAQIIRNLKIPESETRPAVEIKPAPISTPAAKAVPTPKPTPKVDPKAEAKAKADAKVKADAKIKAEAKAKADAKAKAEAKAKALAPARYWAQVAGGANKADLPKAWRAVVAKSGLLKGKTPWTMPLRATNRLLVGPFKTSGEAQAFVNSLNKAGVSAFAVTSAAGQEVDKLVLK